MRRSGTRGVRAQSTAAEAAPTTELSQPTHLSQHYELAPTVPSPFSGTIEASLDAILDWGTIDAATTPVKEELLRPVSTSTNWPALLTSAFLSNRGEDKKRERLLLEEFVFLITRTLLPEQITENRAAMARLYDHKKQLAIRLVLRYDMLRERSLGNGPVGKRDISVASVPPPVNTSLNVTGKLANSSASKTGNVKARQEFKRRELMPNVWPTLIAAPPGGFTTYGVRERMKHYVTPLDDYLLLNDEEVSGWSDESLVVRASHMVLQWQWLRQNNETLQEMELDEWKELDGRAEECEWIAEKKDGWALKGTRHSEEL